MTPALFMLLAAAPAAAGEEPVRLAAPELTVIDISPDRASFYSEHLAGRLNEAGVRVTSAKAIAQLLGAERQRQLLGCNENGSCVAEIAAALGTDGILFGEIAKLDNGFQLNLKVVSASSAKSYSTYQGRAASESGLLEQLDLAAQQLSAETAAALGRKLQPPVHASTFPFKPLGIGVAAAGLIGVAIGTVFLVLARQTAAQLPMTGQPAISRDRADALVVTGKSHQTTGFVILGIGVAVVAAGIATFAIGAASAPRVSLLLGPDGVAFAVSGTF